MSPSKKLCWWLLTSWGFVTIIMLLAYGFLNIMPWIPVTNADGQGPRVAILILFFVGGLICDWYALYQCMNKR